MTWLLIVMVVVLGARLLRNRGWTWRGKYETDTHVCRPPGSVRKIPDGTRWRCRRCGMSWTLDTHGSRWRCKHCLLEWKHDAKPTPNPGSWSASAARIAALEQELGFKNDNNL